MHNSHFAISHWMPRPKTTCFYNSRNVGTSYRRELLYEFLIGKYYNNIYRITWHGSNIFSEYSMYGSSDLSMLPHILALLIAMALSTPFKTCLRRFQFNKQSINQTSTHSPPKCNTLWIYVREIRTKWALNFFAKKIWGLSLVFLCTTDMLF